MKKIFLAILFLAAAASVQGAPLSSYDDIAEAAAAGEWGKVESLFAQTFVKDGFRDLSSVRDLKRPQEGHVYGESEYTFHSLSDVNGQKFEKSGGHKVINKDEKIEEFDFKPNTRPEDLFKKLGFKPFQQS